MIVWAILFTPVQPCPNRVSSGRSQLIAKHLKVLEQAGLIARGREARWRPCRLKARPLKEIADWVEHYRRFWDESFDRLDDYLHELQQKEKSHGRKT